MTILTEDEILALRWREFDATLALALGWTRSPATGPAVAAYWLAPEGSQERADYSYGRLARHPLYSTDIEAAKLATDAMIERGCRLSITADYGIARYRVEIEHPRWGHMIAVTRDIEANARARAALIAWMRMQDAQSPAPPA